MRKIIIGILLLLCLSSLGLVYADGNATANQAGYGTSISSQIQTLRAEIQTKNSEIASMREAIEQIKEDLNNAGTDNNTGQDRKTEVLAANAAKILEHTTAILEKKIAELNEKILQVQESTEIPDENKTIIIEKLNARIDNLEQILSELVPAATPQELRQIINDARHGEKRTISIKKAAILTNSIFKLGNILEENLKNSENYETYKAELDAISEKVADITEDTTKEEIVAIIQEYKTTKQKIMQELETEVEEDE